MYRYLFAEFDGDMEVNTRYDQTTAFYNLIMDAAETARECSFGKIPVVVLDRGVYDFYCGYADTANGSGVPRSIPLMGAAHIRIRGQGYDKTRLRLHGKMQFLHLMACIGVEISDLTIEYADEMHFAPCTNPHLLQIREVKGPLRFDNAQMLIEGSYRIKFERVRFWGEHLQLVFWHCEDIKLVDVAGDISILLSDCGGDFYGLDLACRTVAEQTEDGKLFDAVAFERVGNAVLCDISTPKPIEEKKIRTPHTIYSLDDYR